MKGLAELRARVAGLFVVSVLAACSGNGKPFQMHVPNDDGAAPIAVTGLGGNDGGFAGGVGGGFGGTGPIDAGAPSGTVTIAIQSPLSGAIENGNVAADVVAKVTITGGTDIIDPATVRTTLVSKDSGAFTSTPLVGPVLDNLYTGKLSLAGLPTGDYTLTVTARSSTNAAASVSVDIRVDGGPKITVISPIPGHHYKNSLIAQVIIDPGVFPPASSIASSIAGTAITLQPTGAGNVYRAAFDLSMPVALTGDQVFEVSAKDSNGTTTDIKFTFNVDITGPSITNPVPVPGSITGQVIRIAATVADPAGLDTSSIQVLIGDKTNPQFKLPLMLDATGAFSTLFDTKLLTSCKLPPSQSLCIVRPTISFRAADALGNETALSYEIAIDNIPPIADLVPPPIRVSKLDSGVRCSFAFDPLSRNLFSGDAPDDGCTVPQMFDLRARIEDRGNFAAGLKESPIAGIDGNVTAAYILADTSQPLVVDNDGDGNCDIINPKLVPTTTPLTGSRQVLKVRMKPVPPAGVGDYEPDLSIPAPPDPSNPLSLVCSRGVDTDPPKEICGVEQPTVAISYTPAKISAIWAIEPIAPDDPAYCFGSQLDTFANNVPESGAAPTPGWRCVAIATADMNGNVSTSMPIRVWVDYKYHGSFSWCDKPPATAGPMPSCTGTYDKASDTLSNKACTARSFAVNAGSIEICPDNNCL